MAAPELVLREDLDGAAAVARDQIVQSARPAIASRGRFRLCVDGGRPTRKLLELLAAAPGLLDWSRTDLFVGDERRVPAGDALSNRALVERLLIGPLPVKPALFAPDGAAPDGAAAAARFEAQLSERLADRMFDFVLLGMGPDGHTASLFPGSPALGETQRKVLAVDAPTTVEPHVARITLTPPALLATRLLILFAVGAEKRDALSRLLAKEGEERDTPARIIRRFAGTPVVIADNAAANGPLTPALSP
jgi:6-phosphogluconolactonase